MGPFHKLAPTSDQAHMRASCIFEAGTKSLKSKSVSTALCIFPWIRSPEERSSARPEKRVGDFNGNSDYAHRSHVIRSRFLFFRTAEIS